MATYIIGDVHGCWETLERLLREIGFRPGHDRLIFVGDLVNGGPSSRQVVRWARDSGAEVVLGNHDIHLLAVSAGVRSMRDSDTLEDLLGAPDAEELLAWLRQRPMMIREQEFVVTHAGLHPFWSVDEAEGAARTVEAALRAEHCREALESMFHPHSRAKVPQGADDQLVFAVDVFSRMRMLEPEGTVDLACKTPPDAAPEGLIPWYAWPRRHRWPRVYFGHWAALGLCLREDVAGLDSGCVWGGQLTALRCEDGAVFQVESEFSGGGQRKDEGDETLRRYTAQ